MPTKTMKDQKQEWEIGASKENFSVETEEHTSPNSGSATMSGQLLDGRFLIERDLTEQGADTGGIGVIYLARDMKLLGREVVVKILQKRASQNEDISRKFLHEKEALIRLDHPNIVRILDTGELSDGNPFMVMEYIPGYSLRRVMKEMGKLPFDLAAHIIESVTSALSAAHAEKIIHRDIKPENIMLTPQEGGFDRVRLIDFGIARVEDSRLAPVTTISRGIGTVRYIAPEQLAGTIAQKPTADIYSLGIVIYEMLTGQRPFNPDSDVEMYVLQQDGVRVPPSTIRGDLSPTAENILSRALQFEPEKRPQDVRVFGNELATALRGDLPAVPGTVGSTKIPAETAFEFVAPFVDHTPHDSSAKGIHGRYKRPLLWTLLALLLLTALAIPVGVTWWNLRKPVNVEKGSVSPETSESTNPNSSVTSSEIAEPPRELSYFLNVQKYRGNSPDGAPFRSTGQEIFETGWKIKLVFESKDGGYLYLFNEGKDIGGNIGYNLLFPTPKSNGGDAKVQANQQVETFSSTFNGTPGSEIIWLIWSKDKSADLESIKDAGIAGNGSVKDVHKIRMFADFLEGNKQDKNQVSVYPESIQTVVKSTGDFVVHRLELTHK